ncbi:hypothetical protein TSOC_013885 [Tetrabaena socialis]|uniref:DNA2/NAM7 helicase helicase domain-containing protein n=1 Tax=Tetrabaena socialis TaxID=47790 RepID=A0A2J7ZJ53_9CHLO|nr:hypothetical protein TSOC_013885 [Tetrabaena socialis]|eukprot:PNH00301.1 hypothetical protein TSOC_013885 [Tetrabaena socialis]
MEDYVLQWAIEDILKEHDIHKLKDISYDKHFFQGAASWARTFLPFMLEETRTGLRAQLNNLPRLDWLLLEGPPNLFEEYRHQENSAYCDEDIGASGIYEKEAPVRCTAYFRLQGRGRHGGAHGGSGSSAPASVGGAGNGTTRPPAIKQTDIVLLTNSAKESSAETLGDVYMLGFVKGRWDTDGSRNRGGCSDTWHAVCLGNFATRIRAFKAARDVLIDAETPVPLLTQFPSCATTRVASAGSRQRPGNVPAAAAAVLQAVQSYCENVRNLNPSQVKPIEAAAATYIRVTRATRSFDAPNESSDASGACGAASARGAEVLMVQGPPGTGKTSTIAAMLSVLSGLQGPPGGVVLACAPTNAAVGELTQR